MDFDDFDLEDAAISGGIAGFMEESLRDETRRNPSEIEEGYDFDINGTPEKVPSLKRQIQMLAAENPGLANYIIRKNREVTEQGTLHEQAKQLVLAAERASQRQTEEEAKGILSEETMSDALKKWSKYKWALLDEKEHEEYPELYWLSEAIGESWKVSLDYRNFEGKWEEGLIVLPKRFAKLKGKVFLHAFCEEWKKEWYFRMDRMRNMKLAAEVEQ